MVVTCSWVTFTGFLCTSFSMQLAGIRHGSYCEKVEHNTSGMENTLMEKNPTFLLDCVI